MSCCNCGCVLIKECDIYDLTPLHSSVAVFERKSCIINAHEINLREAIGDECYEAVCTELKEADNDLSALSENWKTVVEDLPFKLMLAWAIYYHWLDEYGSSQAALNGETTYDTSNQDGGKSADSKTVAMKLSSAKSKAAYYAAQWRKGVDLSFCNTTAACDPCSTKKPFEINSLTKV